MIGRIKHLGICAAAVAAMAGPAPAAPAPDAPREVVVGVVRDGPGAGVDLVQGIEREIALHLHPEIHAVFRDRFEGDWTVAGADRALRAALADGEIDFVLVTGPLATLAALRTEPLAKPVLSSFASFDGIMGETMQDGRSTKANLSFITLGNRIRRDLEVFRDLVGFRTVHVAVSDGIEDALPDLRARIAEYERELGMRMVLVEIPTDTLDPAAGLGPEVEAVYVTAAQRLSPAVKDALFSGLAARGIPAFSMSGAPDVGRGALAALTPDHTEQVMRRAALNLSRVIRGEATSDLPVLLAVDTQLVINAETAARVGLTPSATLRLSAVWVGGAVRPEAEPLTVAKAMRLADQGNTSLTISDAAVESAREDQYRARSLLLPQLLADLAYERVDVESQGNDDATRGGVALRQTIFDDDQWSAYRSSKSIYGGVALQRESDRLDVLAAAGRSFLSFGLAEELYRVEMENLAITRSNLELARLRRDVGYSGREEILRWESQLAQDQGNVLLAEQDTETSRIALNQVFGLDQETSWIPETRDIDENVFPWVGGRLDPVFDDPSSRRDMREALVGFAMETEPQLAAQGSAIEAQTIEVDQLERSYFVPSVIADLEWSDAINGDDEPSSSSLVLQEETWSVRVGATYPIFNGGRRKHDLARAVSDLSGLERQQAFTREIVEQNVRTALRRCEASFPRIELTRRSAASAAENLALMRDRYTEGLVNVTDLLEAQTQKLNADRQATSAEFQFELDLIDLERAIAWFEADGDDVDAAEFDRDIRTRIAAIESEEPNP